MYIPIRKTYSYVCYVFTGECYSKWQETSRNCVLKAETSTFIWKKHQVTVLFAWKKQRRDCLVFCIYNLLVFDSGSEQRACESPDSISPRGYGVTRCGASSSRLGEKTTEQKLCQQFARRNVSKILTFLELRYIYIILGVVSGDFCFSCFSATFNH